MHAHVFAGQLALAGAGRPIDGWRIRRRIGMSGGLFTRAVAREIGHPRASERARTLQDRHGEHLRRYGQDELLAAGAYRAHRDAAELDRALDELGVLP